jgi:hypothetical protein
MVDGPSVSDGELTVMKREESRQLGEVVDNVLKTQRQMRGMFLGGQ